MRFIRPDVAITRAVAEITFTEGKDVRTARPMTVLVKDVGRWSIGAAQNTLVTGTPV